MMWFHAVATRPFVRPSPPRLSGSTPPCATPRQPPLARACAPMAAARPPPVASVLAGAAALRASAAAAAVGARPALASVPLLPLLPPLPRLPSYIISHWAARGLVPTRRASSSSSSSSSSSAPPPPSSQSSQSLSKSQSAESSSQSSQSSQSSSQSQSSSSSPPAPSSTSTYGRTPRPANSGRTVDLDERNSNLMMLLLAVVVLFIGLSYASVPLYRMFCQATGFGGTTNTLHGKTPKGGDPSARFRELPPEKNREMTVRFTSQVSDNLPWTFRPTQRELRLAPGETALAFFTARNNSDEPIIGVATYNIQPPKAGYYFTKIQCFCFDEQRLNPHEELDMPVLFFIDPDIVDDPECAGIKSVTLAYTFFRTDD